VNLATQDFKIVKIEKEDLSSSLGGGKTDLIDRYFTVNPFTLGDVLVGFS
jgi:hypothetical protein